MQASLATSHPASYDVGHADGGLMARAGNGMAENWELEALSCTRYPHSENDQLNYRDEYYVFRVATPIA
jgi:hypothetical protein